MDGLKRTRRLPISSAIVVEFQRPPLQHKTTVDDPPPREQIKTFNTLTNEDRAVKFLEKLIHAIGMETSQPGIGAVRMRMPSTATASRDVKSTKEPTKSKSFVNYSLDFVATNWLPLFSLLVILALASMLKDSFNKIIFSDDHKP